MRKEEVKSEYVFSNTIDLGRSFDKGVRLKYSILRGPGKNTQR